MHYKKSEYRKIEKILDMESIKDLLSESVVISLVSDGDIDKIVEKVAKETSQGWEKF